MSMTTKYTRERLAPIVASSISLAEVIRKLEIRWSGGQQQNIKKWISKHGLDTSHFLGQGANRGENKKGGPDKTPWQSILVERNPADFREKAVRLRRALIESGVPYECQECGQGAEWRGRTLIIQINHKNGKWWDNRKENLEFLCPNCHSITVNWSGNKGGTSVTSIAEQCRTRRKRRDGTVRK